MEQTIWKFNILVEDKFTLQMPTKSKILSIQQDQQTQQPCIWALVYPNNPKEARFFELFGTGNPIHNDMGVERKFIGTCQLLDGAFVGHLFERES